MQTFTKLLQHESVVLNLLHLMVSKRSNKKINVAGKCTLTIPFPFPPIIIVIEMMILRIRLPGSMKIYDFNSKIITILWREGDPPPLLIVLKIEECILEIQKYIVICEDSVKQYKIV